MACTVIVAYSDYLVSRIQVSKNMAIGGLLNKTEIENWNFLMYGRIGKHP